MNQKIDLYMLLEKVKFKNNTAYLLLLMVIGVLFFVINILTPLYSDDWHYGYIFNTSVHIRSLSDVFISQYAHYFSQNGRFVPHFLLQTFDGLLGKGAFNIANALFFVLLLHLLNANFIKDRNLYFRSTAISAFAILVLSCGFTNAFLWMSGACNYLWGFTILLVFNYMLDKNCSKAYYPLLFILGIISGWTNEAYIAGYCCGMLFYVYNNRKNVQKKQIVLLCGLLIGSCLLCLAPGSIHRSGIGGSSFSITSFLWQMALNLSQMSNLRLFFIALLLIICRKDCRTLWAVAMLSSFFFVFLTGHAAAHSRFGIEMFALIIILSAIKFEKVKTRTFVLLSSLTIIVLSSSIPFCIDNYNIYKRMEQNVANTKDGIIPLETKSVPLGLDRFVVHYYYDENMDFDNSNWFNTNLSRFYNVQPLSFIQSELLEDVHAGKVIPDFEYPSSYLYYVREWDKSEEIHSVKFILSPSILRNYPIFNQMERFSAKELPVNHYCLLDINGRTYLIVAKNETIDERVVRIEVD